MRICITNLAAYNNGELIYRWVDLPDEEAISSAIEDIQQTPDDEYFLSDWELGQWDSICHEYANPYEINSMIEKLEKLHEHDMQRVWYLMDHEGMGMEEALEEYEDVIFYEGRTLIDVAQELVEEGCYGNIPSAIEAYIDYDAMARDMNFSGEYLETDVGVFCHC
jgi:antirestriction protein